METLSQYQSRRSWTKSICGADNCVGGIFLWDADDILYVPVPCYILLVNELLSPGNCFHGFWGQEAVASCERRKWGKNVCYSSTFLQTIQTVWDVSDECVMLTCSRESPPRQDIGVWGQRWAQVRSHVDLSSLRSYHLSGRNQLPDERKTRQISYLTLMENKRWTFDNRRIDNEINFWLLPRGGGIIMHVVSKR